MTIQIIERTATLYVMHDFYSGFGAGVAADLVSRMAIQYVVVLGGVSEHYQTFGDEDRHGRCVGGNGE
jgi:hypothetical protein